MREVKTSKDLRLALEKEGTAVTPHGIRFKTGRESELKLTNSEKKKVKEKNNKIKGIKSFTEKKEGTKNFVSELLKSVKKENKQPEKLVVQEKNPNIESPRVVVAPATTAQEAQPENFPAQIITNETGNPENKIESFYMPGENFGRQPMKRKNKFSSQAGKFLNQLERTSIKNSFNVVDKRIKKIKEEKYPHFLDNLQDPRTKAFERHENYLKKKQKEEEEKEKGRMKKDKAVIFLSIAAVRQKLRNLENKLNKIPTDKKARTDILKEIDTLKSYPLVWIKEFAQTYNLSEQQAREEFGELENEDFMSKIESVLETKRAVREQVEKENLRKENEILTKMEKGEDVGDEDLEWLAAQIKQRIQERRQRIQEIEKQLAQ